MLQLSRLFTLLSLLSLAACGVEVIILFLPAISATWCDESNPCHKFQIWPDTTTNLYDYQGVLSGREFFIDPADADRKHYKDPDFDEEGENTLIGSFNNLNIHLIIHKRRVFIEENELVGAIGISPDDPPVVDRMELESVNNGKTLVLIRQEGGCDCQ
jgi:hypothetical protein